ncbi:MAG: SIR2 family protein [Candidatus Binatia bacterium]
MDTLHLSMSSCEFLLGLGDADYHWLSETGKNFPAAVKRFIYQTAARFHDYDGTLPKHFLDSLERFLWETQSHVATLNYDDLLYMPMITRKICDGYDGALVDGFWKKGFQDEHMERHDDKNFGYYLHLHGSPLFVDRGSEIVKINKSQITDAEVTKHIVLTHIAHKPTVIDASILLTAYWNRLAMAISESQEILLIGYSGADQHLNRTLINHGYGSEKPVRVVEWQDPESSADRESYWKNGTQGEPGGAIGPNVSVTQVESILDFQEW